MQVAAGVQVAHGAADRYERTARVFQLPWAKDLVHAAPVWPGDTVLDLACGTGFVARVAAVAAGHAGRVVGIDVNDAMVAVARRVTRLDVRTAHAASTGLPDASFDVVVCQQGLQYVPDAAAALLEVRRLLRPGGRVAVSVWGDFTSNPFRAAQVQAMAPYLSQEAVVAFGATAVDSLGGEQGMARLLRSSGLAEVGVRPHRLAVELPPLDDYLPRLFAATPWAGVFAAGRR